MDKNTRLMHIHTGSVDTYENWESDAEEGGWDFEEALSNGSLAEVNEDEI